MKKTLLIASMAIATLTASANVVKEATAFASNENAVSTEVIAAAKSAAKKAPAAKADAKAVAGDYLLTTKTNYGSSYADYNDKVQVSYPVTIAAAEDGGYTVQGLFQPFSSATVNAVKATFADGVLSIAPNQAISTHSTYGDVVPANVSDYTSSSEGLTAITFAQDGDGNFVQTSGAGLLRGIPSYSTTGYFTPYYSATVELKKANATIEYMASDSTVTTDPAVVEETETGGIIYGLCDGYTSYTKSGNDLVLAQEPMIFVTTYKAYGFGYPTKAEYSTEDATWYYYTNQNNPSGLASVEGVADDEKGTLTFNSMAIMAYNGTGGLRFTDYFYKVTVKKAEKEQSGVNDVNSAKTLKSVQYVNINGQVSDAPFNGINVVVSTYTDGTRTATKMMK